MVADEGPQTNRSSLSLHDSHFFSDRQHRGGVDADRASHASTEAGHVGRLQQAFYHPRRVNGLVLSHSIHPNGTRQFRSANDDRRTRCRVSEAEPDELVHFCRRWRAGALVAGPWRRRHWLDVLHALQHHLRKHACDLDGSRRFCGRVLHHQHRDEFHGHNA